MAAMDRTSRTGPVHAGWCASNRMLNTPPGKRHEIIHHIMTAGGRVDLGR